MMVRPAFPQNTEISLGQETSLLAGPQNYNVATAEAGASLPIYLGKEAAARSRLLALPLAAALSV